MGCRFEPYLWSHFASRWRTATLLKEVPPKPPDWQQ
jgi:hypothetical protein